MRCGVVCMPYGEKTWLLRLCYFFCMLTYYGLARYLPVSYRRGGRLGRNLRYWLCKGMLGRVGCNANIERKAYMEMPGAVEIGNNSGIGIDSYLDGPVLIGNNVMMGPGVRMYRRNHKTANTDIPMSQQGFGPYVPLVIEDDVWIGAHVIVVPSCRRIATGSILAAGTVVTKDVPAFSIVGGNPSRVIRSRKSMSCAS